MPRNSVAKSRESNRDDPLRAERPLPPLDAALAIRVRSPLAAIEPSMI
jgi:hypothetical protein